MKTGGGSGGMKNAGTAHPAKQVPGSKANTGGKRSSGPGNTIPGSNKTSKSGHPGGTSVKSPSPKSGTSKKGNVQFSGNTKTANRPIK